MVLDGAMEAPTLICFLQRLIQDARRKVFLILDRLPVHRATVVPNWLARHALCVSLMVRLLPSGWPWQNRRRDRTALAYPMPRQHAGGRFTDIQGSLIEAIRPATCQLERIVRRHLIFGSDENIERPGVGAEGLR
jgi:hypothetical protein